MPVLLARLSHESFNPSKIPLAFTCLEDFFSLPSGRKKLELGSPVWLVDLAARLALVFSPSTCTYGASDTYTA